MVSDAISTLDMENDNANVLEFIENLTKQAEVRKHVKHINLSKNEK